MLSVFWKFPGLLKEIHTRWLRRENEDEEDSGDEDTDEEPVWLKKKEVKERIRSRVKHYHEGRKTRLFKASEASKKFLGKYSRNAKELEVRVFSYFFSFLRIFKNL